MALKQCLDVKERVNLVTTTVLKVVQLRIPLWSMEIMAFQLSISHLACVRVIA